MQFLRHCAYIYIYLDRKRKGAPEGRGCASIGFISVVRRIYSHNCRIATQSKSTLDKE